MKPLEELATLLLTAMPNAEDRTRAIELLGQAREELLHWKTKEAICQDALVKKTNELLL
jgi:hypothetical protein